MARSASVGLASVIRKFRFIGSVLAALAGVLGAASPAVAADPAGGKLKSRSRVLLWSGAAARNGSASGQVTREDRFALNIRLPKGVWEKRPGGVQVAIRGAAGGERDNLYLRVYRGSRLVVSSTGRLSGTAQSVLIPRPHNGRYLVSVGFDDLSSSDSLEYEGLAQTQFPPTSLPRRLLLPDLVSRPQRHVTFQTPPSIFFEPAPAPGQSCFQTEVVEQGADTCLRFDQTLANQGEGPLELRFALPRDPASQEHRVVQRIYDSRGSGRFRDRPAGSWEFHAAHNHYHYNGFALSRLWRASSTGAPVGLHPVRSGRKVSFCITDSKIDAWGRKGVGPRAYQFPDCITPTEQDADNSYLVQGLTPGWADVYEWSLPDQYIEVTGFSDGLYVLQTIVDPDNTVREANEHNNCGSVLLRLSAMNTGTPQAQILRPGPRC